MKKTALLCLLASAVCACTGNKTIHHRPHPGMPQPPQPAPAAQTAPAAAPAKAAAKPAPDKPQAPAPASAQPQSDAIEVQTEPAQAEEETFGVVIMDGPSSSPSSSQNDYGDIAITVEGEN